MSFCAAAAAVAAVLLFLAPTAASSARQDVTGVDLKRLSIPAGDLDRADRVRQSQIETGTVNVDGAEIFYRRLNADGFGGARKTLFLLHGAVYSSDTWVSKVPTVQTMSAAGFDVVAVDLPGFARSRGQRYDRHVSRASFMSHLVSALAPGRKVVLVTPSMSGSFAIPLIVANPNVLCGVVAVSPSIPGHYRAGRYPRDLPVLAVVGQRDRQVNTRKILAVMRNSQRVTVPRGEHAAYLSDPRLWHTVLYNFMTVLDC